MQFAKTAVQEMLQEYNRIETTRKPGEKMTDADRMIALMAAPREDGAPLVERVYQAARNAHYRTNGSIDLDDAFQSMITHAHAALTEDASLIGESYAYILNRARWNWRDDERKQKGRRRGTRSDTFSLDRPWSDDEKDNHETTASAASAHVKENANLALDIQTALDRLPDRQRSAFLMRHVYGMAYPEIVEALPAPNASAAQDTVRRARANLRKALPAHKAPKAGYKRFTVRKFASLPASKWTHARTEDGARVVKSASKTEKFHKYLITYGNGETATIDHRKTIQVQLATPDELTTTDREAPALEYSQIAYIPTNDANDASLTIETGETATIRSAAYPYHSETIDLDGEALHFTKIEETLTIDQSRQRQRQTDETAPAPQRLTRPAKWHEMAYLETYHAHDLDRRDEYENPIRLPLRNTFETRDGAHTCYNWQWFSDCTCEAPPIVEAPAPDDPAEWLEQYNASITDRQR